jgi:hypothetical protein
LSGQALKTELLRGQDDFGQAQGRKEIEDASISDIEKATAEALGNCKGRRGEALTSLSYVWGHEGQGATMQRDANAKNYQGIRNVHNQFQPDPKVKNLLACFSGPEIQGMVDSFKTQPPSPAPQLPPQERPNEKPHKD